MTWYAALPIFVHPGGEAYVRGVLPPADTKKPFFLVSRRGGLVV